MSSSPTGSWFDAEAQSLRDNITEYGELFTFAPFRTIQVNFAAGPDTTRTGYQFWGVYERDAKDVALGMQEVRVSTRHLCVTAMVCDVPNAHQGDRITHVPGARWGDMTPGDVFELTDVRPDGLSGVEMRMVQLGRAKQ
jgi:hypothetical protein